MRKASLVACSRPPRCALRGAARDAQLPVGEPPTPGVYNPTLGVAGDADASAVEKNPASLGFLPSGRASICTPSSTPAAPSAAAATASSSPRRCPTCRRSSLGAGVQLIRPPDVVPLPERAEVLARPRRGACIARSSLGLTYAHLWADPAPVACGLDTTRSSRSRCAPRAGSPRRSSSTICRRPPVQGFPLQRVWEPEIALRPWRHHRRRDRGRRALRRAARRRRSALPPLARRPRAGLTIKADVEWRRDVDLDGTNENDMRVALGVAIDLEHIGVSGFGLFGTDSGVARGHGFTLAARISGDRYPAVWRGPRHLVSFDLGRPSTSASWRASSRCLRRARARRATSPASSSSSAISTAAGPRAEELRAAHLAPAPRQEARLRLHRRDQHARLLRRLRRRAHLPGSRRRHPPRRPRPRRRCSSGPRRPARRARRLREDRRVQERARAVHAHAARPSRRARSAKRCSRTSAPT